MVILFFMSADLYCYLTIGLGFKNYPKFTPQMLKSIHWVQTYGHFIFHVNGFVQLPHHLIGL